MSRSPGVTFRSVVYWLDFLRESLTGSCSSDGGGGIDVESRASPTDTNTRATLTGRAPHRSERGRRAASRTRYVPTLALTDGTASFWPRCRVWTNPPIRRSRGEMICEKDAHTRAWRAGRRCGGSRRAAPGEHGKASAFCPREVLRKLAHLLSDQTRILPFFSRISLFKLTQTHPTSRIWLHHADGDPVSACQH